jgi:hypothetical protein
LFVFGCPCARATCFEPRATGQRHTPPPPDCGPPVSLCTVNKKKSRPPRKTQTWELPFDTTASCILSMSLHY